MPNKSHLRLAETAKRLIKKHGRAIDIVSTQTSGPAYDPSTISTAREIIAVQSKFKAHEIDGDLVKQSDKLYLIDSSVPLKADMRIKDQGVTLEIKAIDSIMPGETHMLYRAQCRG